MASNAANLTEISIENHCSHDDIALITDSSLLFVEIIAFMITSLCMCVCAQLSSEVEYTVY